MSPGRPSRPPPARCPPETHADDRGDEQQHKHRDVEDDDTQQQEKHSGGEFCSAESLPGRREGRTGREAERTGLTERAREERKEGGKKGGRDAEGGSCARKARAWRRARPPTPPGDRRERAAADRGIPAPQSVEPACDRTSSAFGTKQVVRTTHVEVTPGGEVFPECQAEAAARLHPPGGSGGSPTRRRGVEGERSRSPVGWSWG